MQSLPLPTVWEYTQLPFSFIPPPNFTIQIFFGFLINSDATLLFRTELPYFNEKADYTNTTSSSYAATSVNLKRK